MLTPVQLFIHKDPQVLLFRAAFSEFFPQSVVISGTGKGHGKDGCREAGRDRGVYQSDYYSHYWFWCWDTKINARLISTWKIKYFVLTGLVSMLKCSLLFLWKQWQWSQRSPLLYFEAIFWAPVTKGQVFVFSFCVRHLLRGDMQASRRLPGGWPFLLFQINSQHVAVNSKRSKSSVFPFL